MYPVKPNIAQGAHVSSREQYEELYRESLHVPLVLAWPGDRSHPLRVAKTLHQQLPDAVLDIADEETGKDVRLVFSGDIGRPGIPILKDPEPVIAVSEMADSSVNLVVRPWCTKEDYWGLRFDLTRRFKEELESAGCSIPYPQTDVHLHTKSTSAA